MVLSMPREDMSAAAARAIASAAHRSPERTARRPAPTHDLDSAPRVKLNMKALAVRGKRARLQLSAPPRNLNECGAGDIAVRVQPAPAGSALATP